MSDLDTLLGESLNPARIPYAAAGRAWEEWFDAHPLPSVTALDARLAHPETRAGFVATCRAQGRYLIPTVEFVTALVHTLARLPGPWMEVGAGRGDLARAVRAGGLPLIATDDGSWWQGALPGDVARADVAAALDREAPATVLCVWPPRQTNWPALFRTAPAVRAYLLIGDGPRGMTGGAAAWGAAAGWRRSWLSDLTASARCRLDADGTPQTRALLVRRTR